MNHTNMKPGMYVSRRWTQKGERCVCYMMIVKPDRFASLAVGAGVRSDNTDCYAVISVPNHQLNPSNWSGRKIVPYGGDSHIPNYEDKCKELAAKWALSGGAVTQLEAD